MRSLGDGFFVASGCAWLQETGRYLSQHDYSVLHTSDADNPPNDGAAELYTAENATCYLWNSATALLFQWGVQLRMRASNVVNQLDCPPVQ